jgi:hypothetical protein
MRVREKENRARCSTFLSICLSQDNIRYDSCPLNYYFLDKSFQMHFVGKLDGFELKHNVKEKI